MKKQPETHRLPVPDPASLDFHYTESERASMDARRNGSVSHFFTEEEKYFTSDEHGDYTNSRTHEFTKNDMH